MSTYSVHYIDYWHKQQHNKNREDGQKDLLQVSFWFHLYLSINVSSTNYVLVILVISEIYCIFMVLNSKELQTKITIITKDKVTEIFYIAGDFCKFFDEMTENILNNVSSI